MENRGNSAKGPEDQASPPTVRPPASGTRRLWVLVAAGVLVCSAITVLMIAGPSWWPGAEPQGAPNGRRKEPPQAGGTPLEPSAPPPGQSASQPQPPGAPATTTEALKEEAFGTIRQLMQDYPGDTGAMGLMANVHMRLGETAEAATWWQKCIELNPQQANAYHGLAMVAEAKGDREKALELWRKAQEVDPNLRGVYGAVAEVLLDMGQPQEAAAALEKEVRLSPSRGKYHFLLGLAYFQQSEHEKAAQCYQKAIAIEPQSSQPYYGLASACARLGQADKAREYMDKFKTLRDQEEQARNKVKRGADERLLVLLILSETHVEAGNFYASRLRPKEAEAHWQRAAVLEPRNRPCRRALAGLYRRSGRLPEALELYEQLRQIDPGNAATHHLDTGIVLVGLQRLEAAEEAFRKALELAPTAPRVHHSLVRLLLLRNQKLPEAQALAQKLVALEPTAPNYSLLAEACRRNGDLDGAREALRRALDAGPGNVKTKGGPRDPQH